MSFSNLKAGAARLAVEDRTEEAFEAAVHRRMVETGLPERKARFATAIEWGILPEGDVVTVDEENHEFGTDLASR
jgi:hypothetical protein